MKQVKFLLNNITFFFSHRYEVAMYLAAQGFDVSIISGPPASAKWVPNTTPNDTKLTINISLSSSNSKSLSHLIGDAVTLRRSLSSNDVVIVISLRALISFCMARRYVKKVIFWHSGFGRIHHRSPILYRVILIFLGLMLGTNRPSSIIYQNSTSIRELKYLGGRETKFHLVHGCGLPSRKRLNLYDSQSQEILYLGRVTVQKGFLDLVDALTILNKKGYNLRCRVFGPVDYQTDDLPDFDELKSSSLSFFSFEGPSSSPFDDERLLNSSYRCVVIPSWHDGFPRVMSEFLEYSDLPVIAASTYGAIEITKFRKRCFTYTPRLVTALTNAIEQCLKLFNPNGWIDGDCSEATIFSSKRVNRDILSILR